MPMKNPAHPGEILLHGWLEPLEISVSEAAKVLGIGRARLAAITRGRSRITPEDAIRIEKGIGGKASIWYGMQTDWDLAQALMAADQIDVKRCAKAA